MSSKSRSLDLLVVGDHPLLREAIVSIIINQADIKLVA